MKILKKPKKNRSADTQSKLALSCKDFLRRYEFTQHAVFLIKNELDV